MRKVFVVFSFAMMISIFTTFSFASEFSDMPNDWSKTALENAVKNGLLKGDNGKISPNDNLTRAQLAAIINRAFGSTEKADISSFTDVKSSEWFYDDMAKAVQMKTFVGSDGKLNPNDNISREEAFVVLARALKLSGTLGTALDKFSDNSKVSDWAVDGVASLVSAGYVAGSNGQINPKQNISRAEFAKIMDNVLKNYFNKAGTYTENLNGNVMVNVPDVILKGITVNGDIIIGDGVGDGDVTLDGVNVAGRVVVRGGGTNSIKIMGSTNIKNIIITRIKGQVRVFTEGGAEIGELKVDGKDDVTLEGNFENVKIMASDVTVYAKNSKIGSSTLEGENSKLVIDSNTTFNTLTIKTENTAIEVPKGSTVDKLIIAGDGATVSGLGKVENVEANADNVKVSTTGTLVTAATGTTGVTAGSREVTAGSSRTVTTGSTGGGGGGGSSSSTREVNAVIDKINAIGEVTYSDSSKKAIEAAEAAYAALTSTQQEKVTNYATLTAARNTYDTLAADAVINKINAIGNEITLDSKTAIEDAEAAYANLTDNQKGKVSNHQALIDARTAYDTLAASAVKDLIDAIGEVTLVKGDTAIKAAEDAYGNLTADQKKLITADTLKILTDARTTYTNLVADKAAADAVIAKIGLIGEVTLAKGDTAIKAAEDAYGNLTADQKKLITADTLKILTDARTTYTNLVADKAAADAVIAKIGLIGEVTLAKGDTAIKAAEDAYGNLTADQKKLITADTLKILTDARTTYTNLVADKAAADAVIAKIGLIGEVTLAKGDTAIKAAEDAYGNLTTDQRKLITADTLKILTDARTKYTNLVADKAAADAVIAKIGLIGEVTLAKGDTAIKAAEDAYKILTNAQKALITTDTLKVLTDARTAYDTFAANAVVGLINSISTVTLDSKTAIESAETAYGNLTAAQKALITTDTLKVLTDARVAYDKLVADKAAADAVIGKIGLIGEVTLAKGDTAIKAAEDAYGNLTADQKKLITADTLKILTDARTTYTNLVADKAAADAVIGLINAIGNDITLESKAAIESAETEYGKLTISQKALISADIYKKLTDARAAYDALAPDTTTLEYFINYGEGAGLGLDVTVDNITSYYSEIGEVVDTEVKNVIDLINAIGQNITLDSKAKIEAAEAAFKLLTTEQQNNVTNYLALTDARTAYDTLAAAAVKDLIEAIGEVTLAKGDTAIKAAEDAYGNLTADQKKLITADTLKILTDARTIYTNLVADKAAADAVIGLINAIGNDITLGSKAAIESAETEYGKLTISQKALISADIYKKLTDARDAYDALAPDTTTLEYFINYGEGAGLGLDVTVDNITSYYSESGGVVDTEVKNVIEKINAIGVVTFESGDKIKAAEDARDLLTGDQLALITSDTLKILTDARTAYDNSVAALEAFITGEGDGLGIDVGAANITSYYKP